MKVWKIITWSLTVLTLANCSIDVSIEDLTADDFLRSSILATSRGIGDGQTSATVIVLLRNSNGEPVTDYKPTFEFLDQTGSAYTGNGITYFDCSNSNDEGISTCRIRSITVGARNFRFNNISVELGGEIFFDAPARLGNFGQILSSAQIDESANGYSVTSQIGSPTMGLKQVVNGYIIFSHTTGSITTIE